MHANRRDLLQALLAGLGAAPLASAARASASADGWSRVRQGFELTAAAPLNAANLCPAWRSVLDAHDAYQRRLSADPGFINRRAFVRGELARARADCAAMLGLRDEDELAFVRNTSEGNSAIVNGLPLAPGDEVLVWRENHPTSYRSWHYRHRRDPVVVRSLSLDPAAGADGLVEQLLAALGPRTRALSFSHISNLSGTRLPAARICAALRARRPDLFIHIDGAQAWGSIALDLEAIDCDAYTASGHKWLCGPRGTGILVIRRRWATRIQPPILGYDFAFDYPQEALPAGARRFECLGQRDTAAYAALGTAVREHQRLGMARIEARVAALTQQARALCARAGLRTLTPPQPELGHGVVVIDPGSSLKSYGAFLALHNAGHAAAFIHHNRVHCTPAGELREDGSPVFLRLCPHIYNSEADVTAAVAVVQRISQAPLQILRELLRLL